MIESVNLINRAVQGNRERKTSPSGTGDITSGSKKCKAISVIAKLGCHFL